MRNYIAAPTQSFKDKLLESDYCLLKFRSVTNLHVASGACHRIWLTSNTCVAPRCLRRGATSLAARKCNKPSLRVSRATACALAMPLRRPLAAKLPSARGQAPMPACRGKIGEGSWRRRIPESNQRRKLNKSALLLPFPGARASSALAWSFSAAAASTCAYNRVRQGSGVRVSALLSIAA